MSDVIVEVRGGVVVEVYSKSRRTRVVVIDWDNIEEGGVSAGTELRQCATCEMMPRETRQAMEQLAGQESCGA